jgi:uncharacterized protein
LAKRGTASMDEETRQEVASKGGSAVLKKYGREHFAAIGRKGGLKNLEQRGKEYFSALGKRGGSSLKHRAEGDRNEDSVHLKEE